VNFAIVLLKVAIVSVVIGIGWAFINPALHTPFIPPNTSGEFGAFGVGGVMRGAGVIFFAYIGFDAVSTAAQEAKNPKRDMPIGIIGSLVVCTLLYILFSWVLTGIIDYKSPQMNETAIYEALANIGYSSMGTLVVLGVLAGYTSVILVMLLGQSRVFFSMSRDGLLPKLFSDVHPRFRTPWRCNVLLMILVSLFSGFLPLSVLGEMTSIGTLLAFVIVCGGVIIMRRTNPHTPRPYRTPLVPLVPILGIVVCLALMLSLGLGNWLRLLGWLALGLIIYFGYSRHHSKLVTDPESNY
jgi:APA family basic amino acid/polyamine antiporter